MLSKAFLSLAVAAIGFVSAQSSSQNTTFDCPSTTKSNLTQSELQAAMDDFADLFYTQKNVSGAFMKYVASNYIQHNPNILDGRDAAVAALSPLFGSNSTAFDVSLPVLAWKGHCREARSDRRGHVRSQLSKPSMMLPLYALARLESAESWLDPSTPSSTSRP